MVSAIAKSPTGAPSPELLSSMSDLQSFNLLIWAGSLVVNSVISCAVFRAVLRPEQSAFAYLRLGNEELWVMLVQFVRNLVIVAIEFVLLIPLMIVGFISVALSHGAGGIPGIIVGALVVVAVMIWVSLRLSLAGPITFTERQFRLFESWTLTRGRGWRLFGVAVIVAVVAMVIYFAAVILGLITGLALWGGMPHPASVQALLSQPPGQWVQALAPLLMLIASLGFVVGALLTPITLAPWPYIYKQLQPGVDIAATFS
jgi:hypothetical protein